mmetsp:Transcript_93070/g.156311  ORF Transcript_93070/g.156311 Transcript_93070/m.156311 type:complete len:209 (-) Transcript_93070:1079-1705(-)|eukprot:CAMPEP_0174386628 /NCGR_PEP_ID=MMETSP0811_2-20130205/127403_1 /TAXON_ID=73025 ORGANISM="Eutreptiella gymnastica-like, Strain CCMP1594" /NCGR_SAMPLE_ID=MMETSP0811_2 /ASSEMBLY_ACC=CAM_ASM_000667 /LENGTH=208 /DNA_ID=CAMNT_0015541363 /DNA_START=405 /DNA_END=1031 /DNA_ORIENTATION=-
MCAQVKGTVSRATPWALQTSTCIDSHGNPPDLRHTCHPSPQPCPRFALELHCIARSHPAKCQCKGAQARGSFAEGYTQPLLLGFGKFGVCVCARAQGAIPVVGMRAQQQTAACSLIVSRAMLSAAGQGLPCAGTLFSYREDGSRAVQRCLLTPSPTGISQGQGMGFTPGPQVPIPSLPLVYYSQASSSVPMAHVEVGAPAAVRAWRRW